MKRVRIVLAVLALFLFLTSTSSLGDPGTIRIAFFNTLHFGWGGKDCKDLSEFARILVDY
ncbi:hypothetical protein KAX17_14785 [Candidatus Bipolaricaulota bacterium]|nr:hypothetical protein [Candidatus Bipolaricaulota bacterium]